MSTFHKFPVSNPRERDDTGWSGDTSSQQVTPGDFVYTTNPEEMVETVKQLIADDERTGGNDHESCQNARARLESDFSKVKDELSVPRSDALDPPSAFAYTTKAMSLYGGGVMYFGITGGTSLRDDKQMTLHIGSLGTQKLFGTTHREAISLDLQPRSFSTEVRDFLTRSSERMQYSETHGPVNTVLVPLLRSGLPSVFEALLSTRAGASGRLDILQRAPGDLCQVDDTTIFLAESPEALSDLLSEQGRTVSCQSRLPNLIYPWGRSYERSLDSVMAFAIIGDAIFSALELPPSYFEEESRARAEQPVPESVPALDAQVNICLALWPRDAVETATSYLTYRAIPPALPISGDSDWSGSIKQLVTERRKLLDQNTFELLQDPETVDTLCGALRSSLEDAGTRRQEFRVALSGHHFRGAPLRVSDTSDWTIGKRLEEQSVFDPPVVVPEVETE